MQTRSLGTTELKLSAVGLGTWAIGGPWNFGWGPQDDADSIATIHKALDLGINWVDTAPAYGLGHAEEVVGRALAGRRARVVIATKCGLVWDDAASRSVSGRLKAESIQRETEASLKRLGTEVIDLYQIHWPKPEEDIEEAWEAMATLIAAGTVRHAGVSNFSVAQVERLRSHHPVASLQPPYNLLDRAAERELLPYCHSQGIGVIAYGPMAYGLLTGKYTREAIGRLPSDDWRRRGARFQDPELSANLALVEGLRPLADEHGLTLAQLAIAWVLRRREVSAAIVGTRRPSQIAESARAARCPLPGGLVESIDRLLGQRDEALSRCGPGAEL